MFKKVRILYTIVPWIWGFLSEVDIDEDLREKLRIPLRNLRLSYCDFLPMMYDLYGSKDINLTFDAQLSLAKDPVEIVSEYEHEYYFLLSNINMIFHVLNDNEDDMLLKTIDVHNLLILKQLSMGIEGTKVDADFLCSLPTLKDHFLSRVNENNTYLQKMNRKKI